MLWSPRFQAPNKANEGNEAKAGDTVSMKGRRLKNGSPYMTLSEEARVTNLAGKEIYKGNDPGKPGEPGPCAPARTGR